MLNRRRQTPAYDGRYKGWRGPQLESMTIDETGADTESMVSPNYFTQIMLHEPIFNVDYTLNVWPRGKQLVLFSRGKHQDSRENKTN